MNFCLIEPSHCELNYSTSPYFFVVDFVVTKPAMTIEPSEHPYTNLSWSRAKLIGFLAAAANPALFQAPPSGTSVILSLLISSVPTST